MDRKYIILIFTIIVLACVVIGLTIELQQAKNKKPAVNNTTNNTTVTVESINNDTVQDSNNQQSNSNNKASEKSSTSANKESESGMPEETRKIYAAREKAAQDGIPMYEYTQSPELVEKYQSMV